ncbi:60S ribosomal protein L24 [Fusarium fujikuroi]|nr:60S ribosomal protein L24 [Fusarium fujikuroi]
MLQNRNLLLLQSPCLSQQGYHLCAKRCQSLSLLSKQMPQELQDEA